VYNIGYKIEPRFPGISGWFYGAASWYFASLVLSLIAGSIAAPYMAVE
jgi:hypothetical protein